MTPTFAAMSALGWNVIKVPDGNDLQAVYLAVENGLAQARANPRAPVCLWVKTIKGYGVRSTMESSSGGHGFPLANGEKIVDFVNEIYFGARSSRPSWPPGPLALRARLGTEGAPPKKPRPRPPLPLRPLSKRRKSRAAWPRAPCAPPRRACRCIPFPPTWKARRA